MADIPPVKEENNTNPVPEEVPPVVQAADPIAPNPIAPPTPVAKKKSPMVLIIVAIAAVVILIVLGIVAVMGSKNNQSAATPTPVSTQTAQVTASPSPTGDPVDQAIDQVDKSLTTLNTDAANADSGLNDKAPDLSQ